MKTTQLIGCEVIGAQGNQWIVRTTSGKAVGVPKDAVNVTGGFTRWESIEKVVTKIVVESINE